MKKSNRHFWSWKRDHTQHELIQPNRDWLILMLLFTFGLIAILFGYFSLHQSIKNLADSQPETTASSTTPRFTKDQLADYAIDIDQRQIKFEALKATPENITDPSL